MRAGWSSEINRLITGEALSDDFDDKVLNPYGVEIDLPFRVSDAGFGSKATRKSVSIGLKFEP